jgi:hypothetical protein
MAYHQQAQRRTNAQQNVTIFIQRMGGIIEHQSVGIVENSLRFFKRDAVLLLVTLSFVFVPFKFCLTHVILSFTAATSKPIIFHKLVLIGKIVLCYLTINKYCSTLYCGGEPLVLTGQSSFPHACGGAILATLFADFQERKYVI